MQWYILVSHIHAELIKHFPQMPPRSDPRAPNRPTKEERALLLFTFLNPMHEDACCVLGLHQLFRKVFSYKRAEEDSRHSSILRAAMTFLSTKRFVEEHAVLLEHLTTCHCKANIRFCHRPISPTKETLELVLWDICGTMGDYLRRLGPGKFRKEKADVSQDAQPWPSRISDIIPTPVNGEEALMLALTHWAVKVPGGHSVFILIGALVRFWEPFAVRIFQTQPVFRLATQHLRRALDSYKPHTSIAKRRSESTSPIIACAAGFFTSILQHDIIATIALTRTVIDEMYAIAVPIEPILLQMENDTQLSMEDCRRWFCFVCALRPLIKPCGSFATVEEEEISKPDSEPPIGRLSGDALSGLLEVRNRNQCLYLQCTSKIEARTAFCSRCRIVRYCSSECLRAAWAAPALPHKTLCRQIKALRAATDLLDDNEWNHSMRATTCRSPTELIARCLNHKVDQRILEALSEEIISLTHAKSMLVFADFQGTETPDSPPSRNPGLNRLVNTFSWRASTTRHPPAALRCFKALSPVAEAPTIGPRLASVSFVCCSQLHISLCHMARVSDPWNMARLRTGMSCSIFSGNDSTATQGIYFHVYIIFPPDGEIVLTLASLDSHPSLMLSWVRIPSLFIFTIFFRLAWAAHNVTVDDASPLFVYQAAALERNHTEFTSKLLWDGTVTFIAPTDTAATVSLNFTGTAIFIYVAYPGVNQSAPSGFTALIDGVYSGNWAAAESALLYHHLVYSNTTLSNAPHEFVMQIKPQWELYLDEAIYTSEDPDTTSAPAPESTPASLPQKSVSPSPTSNAAGVEKAGNKSHPSDILIGAIVGGVLLLALIGVLWFFLHRRAATKRITPFAAGLVDGSRESEKARIPPPATPFLLRTSQPTRSKKSRTKSALLSPVTPTTDLHWGSDAEQSQRDGDPALGDLAAEVRRLTVSLQRLETGIPEARDGGPVWQRPPAYGD
ncbi:hypothetical protein DFH06DRAFT_1135265 [Mycena polygramma]|nr:hypothetical protein DFH06DRAFT_1135265 [Mycena polygramma]